LIKYCEIFGVLKNKNIRVETDCVEKINENYKIQLMNNEEPIKSKSSVIIERLKKIKIRSLLNKDQETMEDIDWILQNIVDNDINEPELRIKLKDELQTEEKQTGMDYLMEYSHHGTFEKRISDLKLIKKKNLNNSQNNSIYLNGT
jgi:hypothetical protein